MKLLLKPYFVAYHERKAKKHLYRTKSLPSEVIEYPRTWHFYSWKLHHYDLFSTWEVNYTVCFTPSAIKYY